jgi:hypothetical protein
MLGYSSSGRFILINQQCVDLLPPHNAWTVSQYQVRDPAAAFDGVSKCCHTRKIAESQDGLSQRTHRVVLVPERFKLQAFSASRGFHILHMKEGDAMPPADQSSADRSQGIYVSGYWWAEDAKVRHWFIPQVGYVQRRMIICPP